MNKQISAFQQETDEVIKKATQDKDILQSVKPEHDIPLRVDTFSGKNHWRFADGYVLDT